MLVFVKVPLGFPVSILLFFDLFHTITPGRLSYSALMLEICWLRQKPCQNRSKCVQPDPDIKYTKLHFISCPL